MKKIIALMAALMLCITPLALAHTREEVRAAWRDAAASEERSPYAEAPVVQAPYAAGALTDAARRDALAALNFARWLAGLESVKESAIYDYQCQHGAVLLAALDYVDHDAPRPGDMDVNFFDSAHLATTSSSIARFNWMRPTLLQEGVEYFLRDDGDANLPVLGHRRWALNPMMAATGFGLANAASGNSYVVMYAHDLGRADAQWRAVCWPSEGAFPASLMHADLAWSITLNPVFYDLAASSPRVTLSEQGGMAFAFFPADGAGDGFCALNEEDYGAGPCLIFRPDFSDLPFTDYQQNQRWRVRVDGLRDAAGADCSIEYEVEMISLRAQDVVGVEISLLEAKLRAGETLALTADIIPAYADDLTVLWHSTNPAVAQVDENGRVTALSPGRCQIVVSTPAGLSDACAVTVE